MMDDSKLKMNDTWSENSTYSPKQRRIESGNGKSLPILLIILLILIFAGGIIYFLSKGLTGGGASLLQLKVTALEQKIAGLEQQLTELQGKITTSGKDPALLQQVNALAQKVESLENRNSQQPNQKENLLLPQNRQSQPKRNTTQFRKEKLST